MFHIILLNPEIPPNTGNIIRLAANTGAALHIAGTPGFTLQDKLLRRAGLDYHEYARVQTHDSLADAFVAAGNGRRFATGASGATRFDREIYRPGDIFIFGQESIGLPPDVFAAADKSLYIPMREHNRSINLSNAVAIIIMEAWRQLDFIHAAQI